MRLFTRSFWRSRLRDEAGSATVEAVLILPVLALVYVAVVVWFDAYRNNTLAMKATYTVSDMLSRLYEVDEPYMDGLGDLLVYLVPSPQTPRLRVTLVEFNDDDPSASNYQVKWSYGTGGMKKMTQAQLEADLTWIPVMGDDETVVVTQTEVPYVTAFNVGWGPQLWRHRMVTRPRFAPRLTKIDEPAGPDQLGDVDDEGDDDDL